MDLGPRVLPCPVDDAEDLALRPVVTVARADLDPLRAGAELLLVAKLRAFLVASAMDAPLHPCPFVPRAFRQVPAWALSLLLRVVTPDFRGCVDQISILSRGNMTAPNTPSRVSASATERAYEYSSVIPSVSTALSKSSSDTSGWDLANNPVTERFNE